MKTFMEWQKEFLVDLINLSNQHPNYEIHFLQKVDYDEVLECGWIDHQIVKVEIDSWYADNGRIYVGEDKIKEHFFDEILSYKNNAEDKSEEEIEKLALERYVKRAKQTICVYITP
jgi:hypothetical protein